jgi:aspartyl-tRNA(Asn)/glutamyl-tRNA(Gln) amidotransferase subunit C
MTRDLDRILEHADRLQQIDTTGIEPTAHAIPLSTPTRADRSTPGIDPDLALGNAPAREGSAFLVPKVIEGEED